ncbi:hypothetical protein CkaCkLH20_05068 [Colletotrichum karsti]|uniref:Uncharacterized protein n=1 Tax=Colletotrichum karsti TaxID=1095194 RepID=A0A9P6I6P3_9PEZI|nr:uncharacterized protein CkaCkLH20_05068 [Colletotrichum karsti]KAF9877368.1 hypothetical protein CkaCkLH20_05068 [Colletotrichum karsti]
MCLSIKYVCSCSAPVPDEPMDAGEACQLSMMRDQFGDDDNRFNILHKALILHETVPLTINDKIRDHVCQTEGCSSNPGTEFTSGSHPDFGSMARCPGCDNVFSVAPGTVDDQQMPGKVRPFLSQHPDARVPILAKQFWPGYRCTAVNDGCLWSERTLKRVMNRLEAAREFMEWKPPSGFPGNPPPQQLDASEEEQNRGVEESVPSATRNGLPWSDEDVKTLLSMKDERVSDKDIAFVLRKTQKAVNSKLNNLRRAEERLEASRSRE